MKQQTAQLRYVHITPRKLRLMAGLIKGLPVNEAEAQLTVHAQRGAQPIIKLLHSAVADAKNNQHINPDSLVVASVRVDEGPRLKRLLPRARGHATPILKRGSHIHITLKEVEASAAPRFKARAMRVVRERDRGKEQEISQGGQEKVRRPSRPVSEKKEKAIKEPGFFRRIFRRKSV